MVNYIEGISIVDVMETYDCILTPCNIYGTTDSFLLYELSKRHPNATSIYENYKYGNHNKMGKYINVTIGIRDICFCYMVDRLKYRPDMKKEVDYDVIIKILTLINTDYKGKRVCCPLFGVDDNNLDRLQKIYNDICKDIILDVYTRKEVEGKELTEFISSEQILLPPSKRRKKK